MAPGSYSCGVLPGTNRNKTLEELMNLKGASLAEMRAILSTYDIDERNYIVLDGGDTEDEAEEEAEGGEYTEEGSEGEGYMTEEEPEEEDMAEEESEEYYTEEESSDEEQNEETGDSGEETEEDTGEDEEPEEDIDEDEELDHETIMRLMAELMDDYEKNYTGSGNENEEEAVS
jgi:hypothetical protein